MFKQEESFVIPLVHLPPLFNTAHRLNEVIPRSHPCNVFISGGDLQSVRCRPVLLALRVSMLAGYRMPMFVQYYRMRLKILPCRVASPIARQFFTGRLEAPLRTRVSESDRILIFRRRNREQSAGTMCVPRSCAYLTSDITHHVA